MTTTVAIQLPVLASSSNTRMPTIIIMDQPQERQQYEEEEPEELEHQSPKKKRKPQTGAAAYQTRFKPEWKKEFPVSAVFGDPHRFRCNVCSVNLLCNHQGICDIKAHCKTTGHREKAKALAKQPRLSELLQDPAKAKLDEKIIESEVKMAVLCAHQNIPIAFHDKLSPAIRSQFCDSKVAAQYHSASTKTMCMLNGAIAPSLLSELVEKKKIGAFSLMVDGSNDSGLEKMNPLTVRIFDRNSINTYFLDMCPMASSTAEGIFTGMNSRLAKLLGIENPWMNCTAVGVDNTSVNIGVRNSLKVCVQARNPSIYFNGCPCHIIHNAGQKGAEQFSMLAGFDVEEFVVDIFYWFDKSTKRKNMLAQIPGTNVPVFDLLFKVATTVLTIPHSNAGEYKY